jgi:exonuclease SbcC
MIERLRMVNFRRHADSEILLDDGDQIVVIAGKNGAGKTTVLEAIQYALYGEGRHGSRRLDSLVRRGAELEGMEVELAWTMGDAHWRVVRRREGKAASAVLFCNDVAMVEGPRAVTSAVCDVMGMDAVGFRLAVIAQQKELDALARMGGPGRQKALARLLRIDAVGRARDEARSRWRIEREVLDALPGGGDLTALAGEVARLEAALARAQAAEADCRATLAELDAKLAASAGITEVYHAAREQHAAAEATWAACSNEVSRLEAESRTVTVPEPLVGGGDLRVLEAESSELERSIARAEVQATVAAQRELWRSEVQRADARLAELAAVSDEPVVLDELRDEQRSVAAEIEALAAERERLRDEHAQWRAAQTEAKRKADAANELGAACDACGQEIPHTHRDGLAKAWAERLEEAGEKLAGITEAGRDVAAKLRECEERHAKLQAEIHTAEASASQAAARAGEAAELTRRRETYREQLERTSDTTVDVDGLYRQRGEVTVAIAQARAAEEVERARQAAMVRIAELELKLADARVRMDDSSARLATSAIDTDLEARHAERQRLYDAHRGELELLGDLSAQTASSREQLEAGRAALRNANELAATRLAHQQRGTTAAWAQKVLEGVEERMRTSVRPSLEATVSDLVSKLSDGRFAGVRISDDYTPSVLDDGKYRPLWELSGGEQDLVALALRLGLSEVVSERHGGGVGFLILDEVFGSQDESRRASILTALRSLRDEYGQIWCISHVGGLDDAADRLVEVEMTDSVATLV